MKLFLRNLFFFALLAALSAGLQAQPVKITTQLPGTRPGVQLMASEAPADGVYFIKSISTNKYLGVAGIDKANGAVLVQWDYADQANHKFELKGIGNNRFTLKALHSGRYLNVAGQSVEDRAPIIQWDYVAQPNLYFSVLNSQDGRGVHIRGEQSGKFWNIDGGMGNINNGAAVVQTSNREAVFYFEAVPSLILKPHGTQVPSSVLKNVHTLTRTTQDGGKITTEYQIQPSLIASPSPIKSTFGQGKYSPPKPAPADDTQCETSIVRISLENNSFMTADIASQVEEIVPGSVFNILDYLSGSWKRQEDAIKPIVLSGSVKNIIQGGTVFQNVENPRLSTLRQAIATLYSNFSPEDDRQANLSYQSTIKEVNNESEFQLQIGAGAHYLTYSIDNLFQFDKSKKVSYLLIDITKIMFTIDAEPPMGGFFYDEARNQDPNMVYIKKADYGLRILASVEIRESKDVIRNKLNLAVNALVAGAEVSLDMLSRELTSEMTIKMFVVGGDSRAVVPAYSMSDLKNKVETLVRSLKYHTCQPVRYTIATTRDNHIVSYKSATDEFIRQNCTPPAVAQEGARVELGNLMIKGDAELNDDLTMYGKVWAHAYRADGVEIPAERGANMLMDLPGEHAIDLAQSHNSLSTSSKVVFFYPPGTATGGYVDVYFALFELDANPDYAYLDGDDDHFTWRYQDASKQCETGSRSRRLCWKRIYLSQEPNLIGETLGYDGDVVHVTGFSIYQTPHN
jgi:hypothetical protein